MTEEKKEIKNKYGIDVKEMTQLGVNFGHKKSRLHPKMTPYLFGIRNAIHIIDLDKTVKKFEEALDFISQVVTEGKTILFIGTKVQAKDLLKGLAESTGFPYITERWIGGTFTNFPVIKKRVDYLKKLETEKTSGEWDKYTKKERVDLEKKLNDLNNKFGGIKKMEKLPEVVFIVDLSHDQLAVKESRDKAISIVAITDTNTDPNLANYPIPANDDSVLSLEYILGKVETVILENLKKAVKKEITEKKKIEKEEEAVDTVVEEDGGQEEIEE